MGAAFFYWRWEKFDKGDVRKCGINYKGGGLDPIAHYDKFSVPSVSTTSYGSNSIMLKVIKQ